MDLTLFFLLLAGLIALFLLFRPKKKDKPVPSSSGYRGSYDPRPYHAGAPVDTTPVMFVSNPPRVADDDYHRSNFYSAPLGESYSPSYSDSYSSPSYDSGSSSSCDSGSSSSVSCD